MATQPYFEYDGNIITKDNIGKYIMEEIEPDAKKLNDNPDIIAIENAQIEYLKNLMARKINAENQTEAAKMLFDSLDAYGDFVFDPKNPGLSGAETQLGTFLEYNLFGLPEIQGDVPRNAPLPDIVVADTEMKTNEQESLDIVKVHINQITMTGATVTDADPHDFEEAMRISNELVDMEFKRNLAVFQMWRKMRYFLFLRFENKGNVGATARRLHFLAIIYFMRLKLKELMIEIGLIVDPKLGPKRLMETILVDSSIKPTFLKNEKEGTWTWKKQFDILWKSTSKPRGGQGDKYRGLIEKIDKLSTLYERREDFVNELTTDKKFAATFFGQLKSRDVGHINWKKL